MFYYLNIFILATLDRLTASVMQIPRKLLTKGARSIPLNNFYPPGIDKIKLLRKPALPLGTPSDHVATLIDRVEAIPIEKRIHEIKEFTSIFYRIHYSSLLNGWYSHYILSSFFIDARLLRLLLRFAVSQRFEDEIFLRTATDIIEHIQKKFPNSFEYLTPQQIVDWYEIFGCNPAGRLKVVASTDKNIRAAIMSRDDTQTVYVTITPAIFSKFILLPRLERLISTGYE